MNQPDAHPSAACKRKWDDVEALAAWASPLPRIDQQICLLDIPGGKITRIRKGYGMLAFQKDQVIEPGDATDTNEQGF